jgi:agmatinase
MELHLEELERKGLFLDDASMHVGIRGPLYSRDDIKNDESFGFKIIHCDEFQTEGTDKIAERIKKRVGIILSIYQ